MASTFEVVTDSRHGPAQLFDLSLDVGEHVGSMRGSHESAVAGVTSGTLQLGDSVTWRARHFGVWFRLSVRITDLDRPRRFVDEQTAGPFRRFRHEHRFEARGGGTCMVDTITVASPVLGSIVEPLVLVPYLRRLIIRRNTHLLDVLDARDGAPHEVSDGTGLR